MNRLCSAASAVALALALAGTQSASAQPASTQMPQSAMQDPIANEGVIEDEAVEALKEMAKSPNQKMLLLPIEATGILGSLAGIAELAKDSLGQHAKAGVIQPPPR